MTPIANPEDTSGAFQAAWNAHDMAAFGALFRDDATFVNRFAHYVRGVNEIIALHRTIHDTIYRNSSLALGEGVTHDFPRLIRLGGKSRRRNPEARASRPSLRHHQTALSASCM
ncbi:nuclear transport factor 2 family protein [Methylocapsa sp. S129]|uniref:YybH family protein n=1 Tax=Methylocapsa sp. S129 TaxID=1641869 RepID=UPI001AED1837|nr:nuclear transport factor 2 family protein [Methylocapsa sp. S129]